MVTESLQK
ncbi:hypothetical protein B4U79_09419 [Dinothrombium tinctorium]|uniref:Uncharacterized protein n=1 Tax=Dinothrombium tinctorium TaxID=1965070 RepID=A0A3S3PAM6_9ACAR|nr:hypothetical protein B4U79_09419 [Dinothrombium tinctorium]